jgi:hypothetical protein
MEATSVLYLIKKVEQSNCYTVKTWTWLLERTFPDRWGAKVEAKNSGQVDYTIQLRPAVTPERMKELYKVGRESIASPPRFRSPLQTSRNVGRYPIVFERKRSGAILARLTT